MKGFPWSRDTCNAASLLRMPGIPDTIFSETEIYDNDQWGARLHVSSQNTGLSYYCNLTGDFFHCPEIIYTRVTPEQLGVDATLTVTMGPSEGRFTERTKYTLDRVNIGIACLGAACEALESTFNTEFPCVTHGETTAVGVPIDIYPSNCKALSRLGLRGGEVHAHTIRARSAALTTAGVYQWHAIVLLMCESCERPVSHAGVLPARSLARFGHCRPITDTMAAFSWDVDGCNAAATLQSGGFPETIFTETEVWDIGHHGARLRVTDVTGNGVDTDANGNAVPISYECNVTGVDCRTRAPLVVSLSRCFFVSLSLCLFLGSRPCSQKGIGSKVLTRIPPPPPPPPPLSLSLSLSLPVFSRTTSSTRALPFSTP